MDPTLLHHFKGHRGAITDLAFNPAANKIASAALDHSVHLWNFDGKLRCYNFKGHVAAVNSVSWTPSGDLLLSGSSDHTARVWTPTVDGSSGQYRAHTGPVRSVAFNPSGRKVFQRYRVAERTFF